MFVIPREEKSKDERAETLWYEAVTGLTQSGELRREKEEMI
jgi:hypothetical protein